MATRSPDRRWSPESVAVALLGVAFLVVSVLLVQALLALRSRDQVVEATLEDFAAFAAERVAAELNSTFSAVFLDQISASRNTHYGWLTNPGRTVDSIPRSGLPEAAVPVHFSVAEGRLIPHGGELGEATAAWVLETVSRHARDVYLRPAPYAVLRGDGPDATAAVVYRREDAYEGVWVYGFLVRFDQFGAYYRRALAETPLLPKSLEDRVAASDLLAVTLGFPRLSEPLYSLRGSSVSDVVTAEAFAAKAGRMAVGVRLDRQLGTALVAGGQGQPISLFAALAALTLGLFLAALALTRRAVHLSRLRETFIENVSHDLRTPLAQIRMFSETLLLGRLTDPQERMRSIEIIRRQAGNLSDLVDNILHASDREQPPLVPEPTDLGVLVGDTLEALAPAAGASRASLAHRVEGSRMAVLDPTAVRRILMNLVDNGLKYGPEGQTVSVNVAHHDGKVELCVQDQGPGVPPRDRARVWERFHRLDHGPNAGTGTGIGLAVVRQLAQRHGGEVRMEEAPGGGARVVVTLATGS